MARAAAVIESFGHGGFRLGGVWHAGSLLIVGDVPQPWAVGGPDEITLQAIEPVIAAGAAVSEFLLLGMGTRNALPPRAVRDAVVAAGLGIEFMDTPSAARLYNVLTSEGRRLACGLIAI